MLTEPSEAPPTRASVVIVGGGIAGLYCAYKLGTFKHPDEEFDITVLEAGSVFGGRVETVDMHGFKAEFGPMRFEPGIQPLLKRLVEDDLHLHFRGFDPMKDELASGFTARDRYNFRYDELPTSGTTHGTPKPLDLLRLGVLRMFRRSLCQYLDLDENKDWFDLNADTISKPPKGHWVDKEGSRWWTWALDPDPKEPDPWKCTPEVQDQRTRIQQWLDHFRFKDEIGASEEEDTYRQLRRDAKHRGVPMWNEAFWNAMSRELSPAAIRYIRDEGNFYHLFPDNPNAVEWGVFWLRLFRTEADELKEIENGTASLVEGITTQLIDTSHVRLRAGQEVLRVAPAADGTAVSLRVRDHGRGEEYDLEADHCILALSLAPLKALSANFPEEIRAGMDYVLAFPLLKCFLQVRDPWWRDRTPSHAGAFGVPTREIHYQWRRCQHDPKHADSDSCGANARGLVMLYTDHPASEFWKTYVDKPIHDYAEVSNEKGPLKDALIYHLLIQARRQAHLRLTELLLDHEATKRFDGRAEGAEETEIVEFVAWLRRQVIDDQLLGDSIRSWHTETIGTLTGTVTFAHFESVLDVLRNPSYFRVSKCEAVRRQAKPAIDALLPHDKGSVWREYVDIMTDVVRAKASGKDQSVGGITSSSVIESNSRRVSREIEEWGETVEMWGIRDWSRWPVGAGCHNWRPGARSWEILDRQVAFGLTGRHKSRNFPNVHICGEAISDYTGFIEGSLRTAARVIHNICPSITF